ncbi:MAG: isopeptide-forming domain-containing fimbrial protein, partial [Anaerotignum sp.]|nr:isopeptide-forming domain-containing fimbrial protein [Anaerotignum sp.]
GYKNYYYCFVDELSPGLSFNSTSVKVYVAKNTVTDIMAEGVTKADITDAFTFKSNTSAGFELECDDLKTRVASLNVSLDKDDAIFVRYTATLTSGATIGATGNPNEAKVVFSNDPYSNSHGETVEDIVIVFTYEYDVNKVDGAGEELKGAGFTLYKDIKNAETGEPVWEVVKTYEAGEGTEFAFSGLDSGTYKLVETTVPTGYNKADDIVFTITASYGAAGNPPQFSHLTIKGNDTEYKTGIVVTEVENLTGTELPSTGGIGTTIFYVAGGILVVGAAVMLIAKKRTENEE